MSQRDPKSQDNSADNKNSQRFTLGKFLGQSLPLALLFAGLALFASLLKSLSAGSQPMGQPTLPPPASRESALVYLKADTANARPNRVAQGPNSNADEIATNGNPHSTLATTNVSGECEAGGMEAAPRGQWVAIQIYCHTGGFVQVMHAASGQIQTVGADLGPDSIFLGWSPSGKIILLADVIGNPRVYLVNVASGQAELLPVPSTTYNVALSQNGQQMLYSLTRGLGYGSETWIADIDRQNARQVLVDPTHITAFARWSPSGDKIAYIRMPDSNIPFTVGELWMMDGEGNNPVWLGEADAGHGYQPTWSLDSSQIAFVGRENKNDIVADQKADKLISNIYIANTTDGQVENVTQFTRALAENPVWSPDGDFVAFSANVGSGAEVWAFDVHGRTLTQVTHGANAHHPTWLSVSNQVP